MLKLKLTFIIAIICLSCYFTLISGLPQGASDFVVSKDFDQDTMLEILREANIPHLSSEALDAHLMGNFSREIVLQGSPYSTDYHFKPAARNSKLARMRAKYENLVINYFRRFMIDELRYMTSLKSLKIDHGDLTMLLHPDNFPQNLEKLRIEYIDVGEYSTIY